MKIFAEKKKGFTLIELLVVISIIGLLASITLVSLKRAIDRARMGKAQTEMDQIKKTMIIYKSQVGELPPPGDNCSACSNPPNSSWTAVIDVMVSANIILPNQGQAIYRDPWGNYYGYDDNDCNSNPGVSYLRTAGADKILWTADDYEITITQSCADFQF